MLLIDIYFLCECYQPKKKCRVASFPDFDESALIIAHANTHHFILVVHRTKKLFGVLIYFAGNYFILGITNLDPDTIQARSNSDFDVKSAPIQFYGNSSNSQSNNWIKLKFYVESPDILSYLGLKFQVNRSSGRHQKTGQQKLYEFCYLLPFDLWTSYLARILFLKGCGSLFWESSNSPKIFNGLQHKCVARIHKCSESFSYKDSLFILATKRKEDIRINSTFRSDFLIYLGLFNGDKSDSSIFRMVIFGFLLFSS